MSKLVFMVITDRSKVDRYYQALLEKDATYLGLFYVGVKTTSIFCLSTCRARKPKRENVVFFEQFSEALEYGFRPCKICRPTENAHRAPEEVEMAISLVRDNPKTKIKDQRLREEGLNPEQIRRWFKSNYGITFHGFQRMYRINVAYNELKQGSKTTDTAFSSGFESLSGFNYTYKQLIGRSPTETKSNNLLLVNRLSSPLGPMIVCANDDGICLLEFSNRPMLETEFGDLQKRLKASILIGENEHITQLRTELKAYFAGRLKHFKVPINPVGTEFHRLVWDCLRTIPYGTTISYKQEAIMLNREKSVRAVANANGYNKIAIIIPCHRVIGSNGQLTGYGGGVQRKQWLIEHESQFNDNQ